MALELLTFHNVFFSPFNNYFCLHWMVSSEEADREQEVTEGAPPVTQLNWWLCSMCCNHSATGVLPWDGFYNIITQGKIALSHVSFSGYSAL